MGNALPTHPSQNTATNLEEGFGGDDRPKSTRSTECRGLKSSSHVSKMANVLSAKQVVNSDHLQSPGRYSNLKGNAALLKHIFKELDPAVMKNLYSVDGELQLSMKYDIEKEVLFIKVLKAKELNAKELRTKLADPYVKLWVLPDTHQTGLLETGVVMRTLNPEFGEVFCLKMRPIDLQVLKLVAQVWNRDVITGDDFMGEVIIDLQEYDFITTPIHTAWYELKIETDLTICGDLDISLQYQQPDRLLVTIHRGNGLKVLDEISGKLPSPYVKLGLPGIKGSFLTSVQQNTCDPLYEQTFLFHVPVEEFQFRYVVFHVYDNDAKDESIGQIMIDLANLDPDKGYRANFELADLRFSERLRSQWGQIALTQEFKEAMQAHLSVQYPSMLFKHHKGNKIVTLTCRKARSKGRMRLVDGIPVK